MTTSIIAPETPRVSPEWPEPDQPAIVWEFNEPVTLYEYGICESSVHEWLGAHGSLCFGPYAQHKRSVRIWMKSPGRSREVLSADRTWPECAWMVLVRGLHPLCRKEIVERKYGVTVHSGTERMEIETFERWLVSERLEILVDFRASSIGEGWRPPYPGCSSWRGWPSLHPLHLAHWYPDRTVLTCSPPREDWAESRLTQYMEWGENDGQSYRYAPVSQKVSDYLSPKEVAALIASLKQQRLDLQKKRREAKKQFPDFFQRKGETGGQWIQRFYDQMTEAERQQVGEFDTEPAEQAMFRAVKRLEQNTWSTYGNEGGYLPEIEKLEALRDAAQERKEAELRAKAAIDYPVDDAAWEIEIESRKEKELERQSRLREFLAGRVAS
jgi:hypothetical protein